VITPRWLARAVSDILRRDHNSWPGWVPIDHHCSCGDLSRPGVHRQSGQCDHYDRRCGECGTALLTATQRCHDPVHLQQALDLAKSDWEGERRARKGAQTELAKAQKALHLAKRGILRQRPDEALRDIDAALPDEGSTDA
jgi:hypothetical protein